MRSMTSCHQYGLDDSRSNSARQLSAAIATQPTLYRCRVDTASGQGRARFSFEPHLEENSLFVVCQICGRKEQLGPFVSDDGSPACRRLVDERAILSGLPS
ncbi:unnamed protein product [Hapterophycus canaliculatus]